MSKVILEDTTIIKVKTLTTIPFVIAWMLSIPIAAFISVLFDLRITTANQYILGLFIAFANVFFLARLFMGKLNIEIDNEKDLVKLEWDKKPIYTTMEDQIIPLSEIKNWKLLYGRGADGLRIFLNDGSVIKIDFNSLGDFGKNSKKKDQLLRFLISKNIHSVKS